jgi:hypothetical protein
LEDKIICPHFDIGGQGEEQLPVDGLRFYEKLTCPKAQYIAHEVVGCQRQVWTMLLEGCDIENDG